MRNLIHGSVFVILIYAVFVSCSNRDQNKQQIPQLETPVVLDENKEIYDLRSVSKSYKDDIIEKLYSEALEKDPKLRELNEEISEISQIKTDSMRVFNKYVLNNDKYFYDIEKHLNKLSDSTLKIKSGEFFDLLEKKYKDQIKKHKNTIEILDDKAIILKNQSILMKLMVTAKMMQSYQENKLPDIKTLNRLVNKYDSLINDSDSYIKEFKLDKIK